LRIEWGADTDVPLQIEIVYPDLRLDLIDLPASSSEIDGEGGASLLLNRFACRERPESHGAQYGAI